MTQRLFIGVDGGATKCVVRLEDEYGNLLGRAIGGPANIRNSVEEAWQSIHSALNQILQPLSLSKTSKECEFHVGMGVAGCEVAEAYQAFIEQPQGFHNLVVTSDSHTACLGAHGGADGAIIIAGTGTVGYQIEENQVIQVGGWGFPHDDEGGGAWIGMQAIKLTLHWLDGRSSESNLVKKIYAHFDHDMNRLLSFANHANSTDFAEMAPFVIQASEQGEALALQLLQQAAHCIDNIGATLLAKQKTRLPCCLLGGVAAFIEPMLDSKLRSCLRPCLSPPDGGAIFLVRAKECI